MISKKLLEILRDRLLLYKIVGRLIPINAFMDNVIRKTYCPFHDDENHMSAKIFEDDDMVRLHCWVCGRQYNSFDYIKRILQVDPLGYLILYFAEEEIWNCYLYFKDKIVNDNNDFSKNIDAIYNEYVEGKVDFIDFIDKIYNI